MRKSPKIKLFHLGFFPYYILLSLYSYFLFNVDFNIIIKNCKILSFPFFNVSLTCFNTIAYLDIRNNLW